MAFEIGLSKVIKGREHIYLLPPTPVQQEEDSG